MTAIEWTQQVWNPTTGCDRVSPGCDHCYALTMAKRLKGIGSAKYQNDGDPRTSGPGFGITEHPDALNIPLRWRQGQRVFVNSMSDLFHDGVTDEFIARVFAVMAATPQHTYQVLTKRHGRMRSLLSREDFRFEVMTEVAGKVAAGDLDIRSGTWPLPNVWLGVSAEDQKRADLRIPALLDTPAAVRWLSCEPLLGPVDLHGPRDRDGHRSRLTYWLTGRPGWTQEGTPVGDNGLALHDPTVGPRIDWVVAGGESGTGARPMHPAWARQLRDQCAAADVPFFFKQWGEYGLLPRGWREEGPWPDTPGVTVADDGTVYQPGDLTYEPEGPRYREAVAKDHGRARLTAMHRVGKKEAGRELDGRTWDEYPQAVAS